LENGNWELGAREWSEAKARFFAHWATASLSRRAGTPDLSFPTKPRRIMDHGELSHSIPAGRA